MITAGGKSDAQLVKSLPHETCVSSIYAPLAPVRYLSSATVFDGMGNPIQTATPSQAPEWLYVQPVWVFHGHSKDGRATFSAYVQAVANDYLR